MPKKIIVFASGSGSNLQVLLEKAESGELEARVDLVICNKADAGALERAARFNVQGLHISSDQFSSLEEFRESMVRTITDRAPDLLVLAGYLRKIPVALIFCPWHSRRGLPGELLAR